MFVFQRFDTAKEGKLKERENGDSACGDGESTKKSVGETDLSLERKRESFVIRTLISTAFA